MTAAGPNQSGNGQNPWWNSQNVGMGSLLGGMFGNSQWKNPADAANPYMNQIPDIYKQYLSPYTQMGQQAMPQLMQQYQQLMRDPTAMMSKIGAGYQASPGYQNNVDQATKAANQAAAAGGMVGSPQEQQELAKQVSGMANQDYYNYLNTGLGQYGQGLAGMGDMNQMGFNAANNMAGGLSSNLMNQAQLAYAGQQNKNENEGGFWGGLGGAAGGLFGGGLTKMASKALPFLF